MALSAKALNRVTRAALVALLVGGAVWISAARWVARLDPLAPPDLPQRASGDFDGDGRPDVALIREVPGGSQVLVRLSGPAANVLFDTSIVSLIAADIDHDGDLDLVAATPAGDLVVWLNDGRGGFTPQSRMLPPPGLVPAAAFGDSSRDQLVAIGRTAPSIALPIRNDAAVLVTCARAPTVPVASGLRSLSPPSLRAPPGPVGLS